MVSLCGRGFDSASSTIIPYNLFIRDFLISAAILIYICCGFTLCLQYNIDWIFVQLI